MLFYFDPMVRYLILFYLLILNFETNSQFLGGNGDGYTISELANYLNNTQQIFYGGAGDGYSFEDIPIYLFLNNQIYFGGIGDGYSLLSEKEYLLKNTELFSGGHSDGFDLEAFSSYLHCYNNAYLGGSKDGYIQYIYITYLYQNKNVFSGGFGDGFSQIQRGTYLYHYDDLYSGGPGDGHYSHETAGLLGIGIWTGLSNTSWYEMTNWKHNIPPFLDHDVIIPAGCPNYPHMFSGLSINNIFYGNVCKSLKIEEGGQVYSESMLLVAGNMQVAGEYINHSSMDASQRIMAGGILAIQPSGIVKLGTQSTSSALTDLVIESGAILNIDGGYLEVDDQLHILSGGQIDMTGGELFTHRFGEGSGLSYDQPANFYIEPGASASFSGGKIKICGRKTSGGYHSFSIHEPGIQFNNGQEIRFMHGNSPTHFNTTLYAVPGVQFENLTIDKPGSLVTISSDLLIKGQLELTESSQLEIEENIHIEITD